MILSIDTETTGLDPFEDEILTVGICDAETGEEILNRMYKPSRATSWLEAQRVNGISPRMVAGCPPIERDAGEIRKILAEAEAVVVYNADFDLPFLEAIGALPGQLSIYDPMIDFAEVYGEWNEFFGDYKWQKLTKAAAHVGYEWGDGDAHDALADCKASAAVWRWLIGKGCAKLTDWGDMD